MATETRPPRNPAGDPDLDVAPRPDELPGGVAFERAWTEADAAAKGNKADLWNRLSVDERNERVTKALVARRRLDAQARRNGYTSAATDPVLSPPRRDTSANADRVETGGRRRTIAETLVALALDRAEFFHDPDDAPYADVEVDDPAPHHEIVKVGSRGSFRRWLSRAYFRAEGRPPGGQALTEAVDTLAGIATAGDERMVELRLARRGDGVYLDLGDPLWRVVEVGARGWRVLDRSPVAFIRPRGMRPFPMPVRGGRVDDLREFLNVTDEDQFRLLVGWVVGALRPERPYIVLILTGEQDSAKSTTARVLRVLVDPNEVGDRTLPRDERSFAIASRNAWVASFDNVSTLADWQSDALARLATGAGFGTRELYSDDEEFLVHVARPVVLNGIGSSATRQDLMDRAIVVDLAPIAETGRRTETEFYAALERARPALLGAFLNAMSAAIGGERDVELDGLPRMADATKWITAAEPALGWSTRSFVTAYRANRAEGRRIALDADPIVPPLRALLSSVNPWAGTASELLDALVERVDEAATRRPDWPKTANQMGTRLRRVAPDLRKVDGIEFTPPTGRRSGRKYVLARVGGPSSSSSSSSSASVNEDDGRTTEDDGRTTVPERVPVQGDDGDDGDDDLHPYAVSAAEDDGDDDSHPYAEPLFGPPVPTLRPGMPLDPGETWAAIDAAGGVTTRTASDDVDAALAWAFAGLDDEDPDAGGWHPVWRVADRVGRPVPDVERALEQGGVRYRRHRGKGPGEVDVWRLTHRGGDA